ncbi:hypothetical protein C8R44DRAFT_814018 [Mycena epipterygia]|nr:hypothetical protein C8R44DRAFT_814018 [Mycena epipterygia]
MLFLHHNPPPPTCLLLLLAVSPWRPPVLEFSPAARWETITTLQHHNIPSWTPCSMQTNWNVTVCLPAPLSEHSPLMLRAGYVLRDANTRPTLCVRLCTYHSAYTRRFDTHCVQRVASHSTGKPEIARGAG